MDRTSKIAKSLIYCLLNFVWFMLILIASAKLLAVSSLAKTPFKPFCTTSNKPPTGNPTTGVPQLSDSNIVFGRLSCREGRTKISAQL